LSLEQLEEEERKGTSEARFMWKTAVKTEVMMTVWIRIIETSIM